MQLPQNIPAAPAVMYAIRYFRADSFTAAAPATGSGEKRREGEGQATAVRQSLTPDNNQGVVLHARATVVLCSTPPAVTCRFLHCRLTRRAPGVGYSRIPVSDERMSVLRAGPPAGAVLTASRA